MQKWLIRAAFQNRTINLQKCLKERRKSEVGRPESKEGSWKLEEVKWSFVNSH